MSLPEKREKSFYQNVKTVLWLKGLKKTVLLSTLFFFITCINKLDVEIKVVQFVVLCQWEV